MSRKHNHRLQNRPLEEGVDLLAICSVMSLQVSRARRLLSCLLKVTTEYTCVFVIASHEWYM